MISLQYVVQTVFFKPFSHLFLRNSMAMFPSSSWLTSLPFLENLSSSLLSTTIDVNVNSMLVNNNMVEENISLLLSPVPTKQRLTPNKKHQADSTLIVGQTTTAVDPACKASDHFS